MQDQLLMHTDKTYWLPTSYYIQNTPPDGLNTETKLYNLSERMSLGFGIDHNFSESLTMQEVGKFIYIHIENFCLSKVT